MAVISNFPSKQSISARRNSQIDLTDDGRSNHVRRIPENFLRSSRNNIESASHEIDIPDQQNTSADEGNQRRKERQKANDTSNSFPPSMPNHGHLRAPVSERGISLCHVYLLWLKFGELVAALKRSFTSFSYFREETTFLFDSVTRNEDLLVFVSVIGFDRKEWNRSALFWCCWFIQGTQASTANPAFRRLRNLTAR
jgi:hypothetical protein